MITGSSVGGGTGGFVVFPSYSIGVNYGVGPLCVVYSFAVRATGAVFDGGAPVNPSNTNATIVVTDNHGNTYVALPPVTFNAGTPAALQQQIVYCLNPVTDVDGNVIVTWTGAVGQLWKNFWGYYTDVAGVLVQNVATLASGSSISTAPVTPTIYGSLFYTALGSKGAVSSGTDHLTPTDYALQVGGFDPDLNESMGFHIEQTNTLAPVTHTWHWTGTHAPAVMATAIFSPISTAVPNVVGMTVSVAIVTLTAAGFALGRLVGAVGTVVTVQNPPAGALAPVALGSLHWHVDLTLGTPPDECLVLGEDWSAGNSLCTSVEDYSRSSDGVDPVYPAVEAAEGVSVVDGQMDANTGHVDDYDCTIELAHMGPFYGGGGGSLTSYYGSPGFWVGQDGAIEFTYTPTDVTVAQYGLLVSIEDYMLTIEYDPDDGYSVQAYSWSGDVDIEGVFLTDPGGTVAGVSYRWRIEWQCSSGPFSVFPVPFDGYLRIFRDGEMVFEQTDIDLYLNGDSTTPDNLMHTVVFGDGSLFGALDDVVIACAAFASEPPATEYEPAADTGLTWAEWELEDEVVVTETAVPPVPSPRTVPANDLCANAQAITVPFSAVVDTTGATNDPATPDNVWGSGDSNNGVWYVWTAPGQGVLTIFMRDPDFAGVITVYTGTCGALVETPNSDGASSRPAGDTSDVIVAAGVIYYFLMTSYEPGGMPAQELAMTFVPELEGAVPVGSIGGFHEPWLYWWDATDGTLLKRMMWPRFNVFAKTNPEGYQFHAGSPAHQLFGPDLVAVGPGLFAGYQHRIADPDTAGHFYLVELMYHPELSHYTSTLHRIHGTLGTVIASWPLPQEFVTQAAVSPDGATLYYQTQTVEAGKPVLAYDLAHSVALPNFVANTGINVQSELRVLQNGDVLVAVGFGTTPVMIRRYNPAGVLQASYGPLTADASPTVNAFSVPYLGLDASTFWVYLYDQLPVVVARQIQIETSTGAILADVDVSSVAPGWGSLYILRVALPGPEEPEAPEVTLEAETGLTWVEIEN